MSACTCARVYVYMCMCMCMCTAVSGVKRSSPDPRGGVMGVIHIGACTDAVTTVHSGVGIHAVGSANLIDIGGSGGSRCDSVASGVSRGRAEAFLSCP
jgi:hypothetical protein